MRAAKVCLLLAYAGAYAGVGAFLAGSVRGAATTTHARERTGGPPSLFFDQIFGGGKAKASHILLTGSDGSRAQFIKQQIEGGELSFEGAARQFSTCPSSSKGGDLGLFGPGAMVPQFDAYCFDPATKVGELGIVRTQFGTHIVKLTKKP